MLSTTPPSTAICNLLGHDDEAVRVGTTTSFCADAMIRGATDLGANAAAGAVAQSDAIKAATREVFDRLIVYLAGHECE